MTTAKLGTMIGDILGSLVKAPATRQYPLERQETPARLRGLLHWSGAECIGCTLCAKDCPANALNVIVLDKKAKRFVVEYHVDRCTFCAQCVESCRRGCLEMSSTEWELASGDKASFHLYYGAPADVEAITSGALADSPAPGAAPSEG